MEPVTVDLNGSRLNITGFSIVPGERLVVFGPNGAGKTTLLRQLVTRLGEQTAYLPQQPHLFRGSVGWNLGLGLDAERACRARSVVDALHCEHLLVEDSRRLSGGERQRIALARVLARSEPWVLLDEPLSAIDLRDRQGVARVIVETIGERGSVIVTHDREVATLLGTRMAVMVRGRLIQTGSVGDVFSLPESDEVADVVGIANAVDGTVTESDSGLAAIELGSALIWGIGDILRGGRARAVFGAEGVTLYRRDEAGAGSARNQWQGTVTEIREVGRLLEVIVDTGFPLVALITPGAQDLLELAVGMPVMAAVKATAVKIYPR